MAHIQTTIAEFQKIVPLVLASGAGAQSRISIGTVVLGGMMMATVLSLGLVPVFYVIFERMRERAGVDGTATIQPIDHSNTGDGF